MTASFTLPASSISGITKAGTAWSRCGSGETVVLIHGVGMNKNVWAPQVLILKESFDVLVYDMWGHGESDLPDGELALSDYVQQLIDLMSELQISKAHVVGHSIGALIALTFACNHSDSCKSVSAITAVFDRPAEKSTAVKKRAAEILADGNARNDAETIERWFGSFETNPYSEAAPVAKQALADVDPMGYARAYSVFANSSGIDSDSLSRLVPPSLFLTADGDPNSTPEMSQKMSEIAVNGHLEVIAGHRHMVTLSAPEQICELLTTFFNSCSTTSEFQ
jgi:pimeloyl-ACP methyl ester carboxylesterase